MPNVSAQLPRMTDFWRNRDLSVVAGSVCFQGVAKLTSTADMKAHCRPAAWQSVGVSLTAFLLKLGANRPRCHQLPKCERRNGLMGLSLIEPLVLKEER